MAGISVSQYGIHDFSLQGTLDGTNPFMVQLTATFEHESGTKVEGIPGFYNGDGEWVVRFSPTKPGRWCGSTSSHVGTLSNIELDEIECVPSDNPNMHGKLQIDPEHPQRFAWEDGTPFILLGFECDWLFSYHQEKPDLCHKHMGLIQGHGFNYIIMNIYAHTGFSQPNSRFEGDAIPGTLYGPPRLYAFGGTNDEPDHTQLNVDFFKDYDQMMAILHEKGIVAHLMIQVQNKRVRWPKRLSAEDDMFWRYVVARYQAFGNVVWDIGKESYNLLKETGSHGYTLSRIDLIRTNDAYDHLVTVHDSEAGSTGRVSVADEASDFCSDQIHLSDVDRYYREATSKLRLLPTPYFNLEYGYELGAEDLKTYKSRTTAPWQDLLRWTYAFYMAGAYPGYYYSNTSWDLIRFEPEPEGWRRYRYLMDVLTSLDFNAMTPLQELVDRGYCLAIPGEQYLIYLPEGGNVSLDLTAAPAKLGERGQIESLDAPVKAEWMDIYTGERSVKDVESANWGTRLENPLADAKAPCVIVVRVAGNE